MDARGRMMGSMGVVNLWQTVAAAVCLAASGKSGAAERCLVVDLGTVTGMFRPLNGLNKGPLAAGGMVDLTMAQKELAPPLTRLHDCHWPNPDVVDIHAVFPRFDADPRDPGSYDFARTDEYLEAVRATGARIVYRLGESIEHTADKRFVHPPADPERWAQVCIGIARHCNEGWAAGRRLGIEYWEIWNEPENRPAMWTGTDEQFLELYATAAKALKRHDPRLKIGGPSFGHTGQFVSGKFQPSSFVTNFLGMCRRAAAPLDFFSWHCYTANVTELVDRARAMRALLDSFGFKETESHLNEWNYLPGTSWSILSRASSPETRQNACDEMSGASGGAFVAAALIEMQDAPIDAANLYHGETGCFGLFTELGVPRRSYYGVLAVRELFAAGRRMAATGGIPGRLAFAAGLDGAATEARILVSNFADAGGDYSLSVTNIPWRGLTSARAYVVDERRAWEMSPAVFADGTIKLRLAKPAVALVVLSRKGRP